MISDAGNITGHEALDLLSKGECSSEDLVRGILDSIKSRDGALGAYLYINEEDALAQAKAADAVRAEGGTGKLLGVPIAIKDNMNVKGQPCTCASHILEGYNSLYDATVVSKLRAAGAVLLGRTNMDEFAMGSSTENSALGVTRNPVDNDRVPGGSSGGSAAAVAGGEAIAALGSDTGGSIRQPASFCGCVGLKPTYGRVSRYGLVAFASSLDQIGPLTKDVEDSALIMEVISGHDPMDSTCIDVPVPEYTSMLKKDMNGVKIGLPKEYFVDGMDAEIKEAVMNAVEQCRSLGAEIIDVSLPHTEYAISVYYVIAPAEASANLARFDGVRYGFRADGATDPIDMYGKTRAQGFGDEVKRRIILGTYVLSSGYYDAYYLSAQKVRTLIRKDFEMAFKSCDVMFAPTTPTAAFPMGANTNDPLQMYLADVFTATVNLAGVCSMSIPCGKTSDDLPIGLQIIGPSFKEENVLSVGYAYEKRDE